jgi:hypothetical protein
MDQLLAEAERAVAAFVAQGGGFSVAAVQPTYRGGTNRVTFGARNGDPVVFKYFVSERRSQNERSPRPLRSSKPGLGCSPRRVRVADRVGINAGRGW